MLHQIARNFATMGADRAAEATADHLATLWDPGMRARIAMLARESLAEFGDIASQALAILDRGVPEHQTQATQFAAGSEVRASDAG